LLFVFQSVQNLNQLCRIGGIDERGIGDF